MKRKAANARVIIPRVSKATTFDQQQADRLCADIASGQKSLRTICKKDGMPNVETVLRWLRENTDFLAQYTRSKREQAELMAEDMLDIADDGTNDTQVDDEGNTIINTDIVMRSRLRIETRKWLASKLLPKKYGDTDKTTVNVGVAVNNIVVSETERAELMLRKRQAAERAKLSLG